MDNNAIAYLTPEQVADRLQVVVETVYRWLRTGKLRGSRLGRKTWRVAEPDLNDFMKGSQNEDPA
jgi:excisionase family DNA binding protein